MLCVAARGVPWQLAKRHRWKIKKKENSLRAFKTALLLKPTSERSFYLFAFELVLPSLLSPLQRIPLGIAHKPPSQVLNTLQCNVQPPRQIAATIVQQGKSIGALL